MFVIQAIAVDKQLFMDEMGGKMPPDSNVKPTNSKLKN